MRLKLEVLDLLVSRLHNMQAVTAYCSCPGVELRESSSGAERFEKCCLVDKEGSQKALGFVKEMRTI